MAEHSSSAVDEVEALVEARARARALLDFATADRIRDVLEKEHGVALEDLPSGETKFRRPPWQRDPLHQPLPKRPLKEVVALAVGGDPEAKLPRTSVVRLASAAVELSSEPRRFGRVDNVAGEERLVELAIARLVEAAVHRLRNAPVTCPELASGAAPANAAMRFALAGAGVSSFCDATQQGVIQRTADQLFEQLAGLCAGTLSCSQRPLVSEWCQLPQEGGGKESSKRAPSDDGEGICLKRQDTPRAMAMLEKLAVACVSPEHPLFSSACKLYAPLLSPREYERATSSSPSAAPTGSPTGDTTDHSTPESSTPAAKSLPALLRQGHLCLFDDQPLVWLFRHAARQRKRQTFELGGDVGGETKVSLAASNVAHKLGLPLSREIPSVGHVSRSCERHDVLDLGCGFGTSVLGLAWALVGHRGLPPPASTNRSVCVGTIRLLQSSTRLLGFDLNLSAVRFARGSARRLGFPSCSVAFAPATAEDALCWASTGPQHHPLSLLLQFPTPFKVQAVSETDGCAASVSNDSTACTTELTSDSVGQGGNSQLPADDHAFMVNAKLVDQAVSSMRRRPGGFLFLQSNVEDVAVAMRKRVEAVAGRFLRAVDSNELHDQKYRADETHTLRAHARSGSNSFIEDDAGAESSLSPEPRTLRQQRLASLPAGQRSAVGPGWLHCNPLPRCARTETEAVCELDSKPVYRVLFVSSAPEAAQNV
eukprot:INCI1757.1.p1 GENE.INCI1757.1~~INCI1757.1.p1  ORF type:complete len:710 (+),score=91.15 INCI1757.1:220-2349(+)